MRLRLIRTLLALALVFTLEAALQRYEQARPHICQTGATPEHIRLYEELVKATEAARYGGGRESNFWGPRPPELAYQDCFQAPGWGD
ncbi:MAG: hypothetical protein WAP47_19565 [Candidatus Rokuibacteriota bacterium]